MDSKSAKYRVSLATRNNWFPGHTIEVFEFITSKFNLIDLKLLESARDKAGKKGQVVGYVLVEMGTAKKEVEPAKAVKVSDK